MVVLNTFIAGSACILFGAIASLTLLSKARNYSYLFSSVGSLLFLAAGGYLLYAPAFAGAAIPVTSNFSFGFSFDALAGFFVVLISIVSLFLSFYSVGLTRGIRHGGYLSFFYHLLLLSMYGVVLSSNIVTFLVCWETMAVASYFLIVFDRNAEAAKAGLFTVVMTHIGTVFIIALFLVLARFTGSMEFSAMRSAAASIPSGARNLIFIFALIGFGTKAGIIPLHTWIPRAYPVAPSNVTPLMSGVMIKTAVYGFLRICLDVLGPGPEWWGILVIAVGAASAVLGILYAVMESDLKVFLAYSSVENVGIILMGIGASMTFRNSAMHPLASFALAAALFHALNHALFKSLLFQGAGSVVHAAGTRNMEQLGGLLKNMPWTGALFLAGTLAITALPPLNGFVSEWLTYQALLLGFKSSSVVVKIVSPLGGAALALTGAIVAAGFVKTFATTFLGMPRSEHAIDARESSPWMIASMSLLAFLCLIFGVFPGIPLMLVSPAVFSITGSSLDLDLHGSMVTPQATASLSTTALALSLVLIALAAILFVRLAGGRRRTVIADSWDCGIPALNSHMQYTAAAFTKPLRIIYKRIYLPNRELKVSYIVKPFFVRSITYGGEITPFFERYVYEPVMRGMHTAATKIKLLQSGSLQLYLGYILITLIALLIFGT